MIVNSLGLKILAVTSLYLYWHILENETLQNNFNNSLTVSFQELRTEPLRTI